MLYSYICHPWRWAQSRATNRLLHKEHSMHIPYEFACNRYWGLKPPPPQACIYLEMKTPDEQQPQKSRIIMYVFLSGVKMQVVCTHTNCAIAAAAAAAFRRGDTNRKPRLVVVATAMDKCPQTVLYSICAPTRVFHVVHVCASKTTR